MVTVQGDLTDGAGTNLDDVQLAIGNLSLDGELSGWFRRVAICFLACLLSMFSAWISL